MPFENTNHRHHAFSPNFKRKKVDAGEFLSDRDLTSRVNQRKGGEDSIAVATTGNSRRDLIKSLKNASEAKQIDMSKIMGSVPRHKPSITAPPHKPIAVAAGGNLQIPLKPLEHAAQSRRPITSVLATPINQRLKNASQARQIDTLSGGKNIVGQQLNEDTQRKKVREALSLYKELLSKLMDEPESKLILKKGASWRIHMRAAMILRDQQKWVNTSKQFGTISGVEIGDIFRYRVELVIVGLHRSYHGGIDYMKKDGKVLATSIVASERYPNNMDSSDVLVYSGQGGNPLVGKKQFEDQKLERGNLALYNSVAKKNPIRVIRGYMPSKIPTKYVYEGLYVVDKYWQETGDFGKLVFKFQLKRLPGQAKDTGKEPMQENKPTQNTVKLHTSEVDERICIVDISRGKDDIPIPVVNSIDDAKLPSFTYITTMVYPRWYIWSIPRGCDCTDDCLNTEECSCVLKNGGEIPFKINNVIVKEKPLFYECGPSCKCYSSCNIRVSQRGIKFSLEVFKTVLKGWGVRSRNYISSRSFICEYVGELLHKRDEKRSNSNEYLFDIRSNFEVMDEGGLTIDATKFGNVGRFINHSCSPNLYAQSVLYDHGDKRVPHIMLFAITNIPPYRELTYDYHWRMSEVHGCVDTTKLKKCRCDSPGCRQWIC